MCNPGGKIAIIREIVTKGTHNQDISNSPTIKGDEVAIDNIADVGIITKGIEKDLSVGNVDEQITRHMNVFTVTIVKNMDMRLLDAIKGKEMRKGLIDKMKKMRTDLLERVCGDKVQVQIELHTEKQLREGSMTKPHTLQSIVEI